MAVRMYSEMVTLQTMDSIFFWYRGKEEFPSTSPQWEKKQLTLHQQLRFLLMIYLASGDGIVVKGQAYGIWSIRVDGNDALAVYSAVHTAREIAIKEQRPVLIEV